MKTAVLSNINLDYVSRLLKNNFEAYEPEGYGNELGALLNPESSYHRFRPDITFIIMDTLEMLGDFLCGDEYQKIIDEWFQSVEHSLQSGQGIFYIANFVPFGLPARNLDIRRKNRIEILWNERLFNLHDRYAIRIFDLADILNTFGFDILARKEWYLGKMRFNGKGQKIIANKINHLCQIEAKTPKKLLILDLDNTLWGGLAGEHDITPVLLSDSATGLIFKECQKIIKNMALSGVLLAVVSKNNFNDAIEIMEKHPHMLLHKKDFISLKINWEPKHENIKKIAEELNIGFDSFVFWDDSPNERNLVKTMLPEVIVPDFPDNVEELPEKLLDIHEKYFARGIITSEDKSKTEQYAANFNRMKLKESALSFNDYCRQLQIVINEVDAASHMERLLQLANKTNQFNLTTKRFTHAEFHELLANPDIRFFSYQVEDKFGDNGIVALVIARLNKSTKDAVIEEFVMSCRVMGRLVENAILDHVEHKLLAEGIAKICGLYFPTAKNMPVSAFYQGCGYNPTENKNEFVKYLKTDKRLPYEAVLNSL